MRPIGSAVDKEISNIVAMGLQFNTVGPLTATEVKQVGTAIVLLSRNREHSGLRLALVGVLHRLELADKFLLSDEARNAISVLLTVNDPVLLSRFLDLMETIGDPIYLIDLERIRTDRGFSRLPAPVRQRLLECEAALSALRSGADLENIE